MTDYECNKCFESYKLSDLVLKQGTYRCPDTECGNEFFEIFEDEE
jgi:hypothetical protein